MIHTPWAVLLCKFGNNDFEPFPRKYYEDLFTTTGVGSMNMVDYFHDVSHGALDLSGTKVFPRNNGWYTPINQAASDYNSILATARNAAMADGVNLAEYFSVLVCTNWQLDTQGAPGGVVADAMGTFPAVLGHEMGHAYGLSHSGADGSTAEYGDPWDIMSAKLTYMADHPEWRSDPRAQVNNGEETVGPILNACNMAAMSWLDETRVWTANNGVIALRPLIRRDLPGFLAARLGSYLVEFRVKEGWDARVEPVVLVHRFEANRSYLMSDTDGRQGLIKGSVFQVGDSTAPLSDWIYVKVLDIDASGYSATLELVHRLAASAPVLGPGALLGGVTADGGGWIILGKRVIHVPPRSPAMPLLEEVAAIQGSDLITNPATRDMVRREALSAIAGHLEMQRSSLSPLPAHSNSHPKD